MRAHKRIVALLLLSTLYLGAATAPSYAGAGTTIKGSAVGTANPDGSFQVVIDANKVDAQIQGQLAPRTGTGTKKASTDTFVGPDGSFDVVVESSQMTATAIGHITTNPVPPQGSAIHIEIKCNVSYPPLSIKCTIIITQTAAAST